MSRIRSIHPGQWTDEDFVECSFPARLLAISLRNEADDNGIFEWRPTRLKMRIFPADALDVAELLDELAARSIVMKFEAAGRAYGAIRNFRVFQNPRSPKAEHPITAEAEAFVGERQGDDATPKRGPGRPRKSQDAETKSVQPKSFPQNVENNSLMERRGEESNISPSDSSICEIDPRHELALRHPPPVLLDANEIGVAFEAYQDLRLELKPGSRPIELTVERRRKLTARLRDVRGRGGWPAVLAKIRGSPFLRGETSRDGKLVAEIDWLLKPANLTKLLEGNYDERSPNSAGGRAAIRGSPIDALSLAITASGLGG